MSARGRIQWTRGALYGIASAALFGLSAPLSKRLLPNIGPMPLAGLLYLGAGAGLTAASEAVSAAGTAEERQMMA